MMDSRTILDRPGANQLIGRGDMLFLQGSDPVRVQCAFVDTPEVEKITDYISRQQGYTTAFYLPEYVGEESESTVGDVDMIDKIDYQKCMDLYKDRFKDASDFTFILVGNVDLEKAKPLIEQYLGSLPSINRKETFKDTKMYTRKGQYKNEFKKKQQTAKASVFTFYNGSCKYTSQNDIMGLKLSESLTLLISYVFLAQQK